MDWRTLRSVGTDRGEEFYLRCLSYGNYLWVRGLVARALLAVDRGLLCAVNHPAPVLTQNPLPYRAVGWMLREVPRKRFFGNPRVHYQHLADRVRGEREEQRRWRAWACWYLVRLSRPELVADPDHMVEEPTEAAIRSRLDEHGIAGERAWWQEACAEANRTVLKTPAPDR